MKQPEYVRVNDFRARVEAEPVPPDKERCRWREGGERCPRRATRRLPHGTAYYCDACRPLAAEASRIRRYERWKRSNGGANYREQLEKSSARSKARVEAGDPVYVRQALRNKERQRRNRERMKREDPEAWREYRLADAARAREYRRRKKEEAA